MERAAALNPEGSRLVGVRVGWMLALGWGFASVLGAVSGMMVAPTVFLDPNMMRPVLLYAIAAAILGGLDSTGGALVGGLIIGLAESFASGYQDQILFLGRGFGDVVPYVVMILVLLVRPSGLFGTRELTRV